jgi:alkanesulfonate monooxygenase SsuD/methylene tetrahydromethanopterin reductase-like flavin-dependent oxidoreductase (luciferase family)
MKIGVALHTPGAHASADVLMNQARTADRQGFDSVWLGDHLLDYTAEPSPDGPFDSFTLMAAVAAVTERVRLGFAMLNTGFRNPAHLAKMLATLDHISRGRVICSLGSGWFEAEYTAYGMPFISDHSDRVAYGREVVELVKQLWTNPAPERVTFSGRFVQVSELPFNPAPYQKPHPPIWIGGDSDATLANVKDHADGWLLAMGGLDRIEEAKSAPDWPSRPMVVGRANMIAVGETVDDAKQEAGSFWDALSATPLGAGYASFEDFCAREVVGQTEECLEQLAERERRGQNYIVTLVRDAEHQERIARLLLPHLG